MSEKKGYGIVIPKDWKIGKWNKLTAQEIVHQLKELNRDAFYSMAANVGIDLALLEKSGYEYDGLSDVAEKELEAFVTKRKFSEVQKLISEADYQKYPDFQYVLHLHNDRNNIIAEFYTPEIAAEILKSRESALRNERESIRNLMALFIDEFEDERTEARKKVLEEYGGRFISMPELDTFLSYRDDIEWYRGDTFDPEFKETSEQMKAMRDLIPLYKLIRNGGEFQVQSTKYKHHKLLLSKESAVILADAIALALKILHNNDPFLNPGGDNCKGYTWVDLICSRNGNEVEKILESVNSSIENYESEFDLSLFYYLADNAIQ